MNILLLRPEEIGDDAIARLTGRRARHARSVLRAVPGDEIRAGLLGGRLGTARVLASTAEELTLALEVAFASPPPPAPGIDLILALPRPKMARRILAAATTLGVKRIALVNAARVEKSFFDSPLLSPASVEETLWLALEQARDTILPVVSIHPRWRPFVEDEVPHLWPIPVARRVADPGAPGPLASGPDGGARRPSVVAIGPEGGFVPFEVDLLVANGFVPFHMGARALRVETAVVAAIAQIALVDATSAAAATSAPGAAPTR